MSRLILVLVSVFAAALTGVAGAGVAGAEPPPPCGFMLSPPQVVDVSGAPMVTATVEPAVCLMPGIAAVSVACIRGADGTTQCTQAHGSDTAQVYTPYRPGATYTSTGRGLGAWNGQWYATPDWQILGPFTATL
jgi:hypothetical protein